MTDTLNVDSIVTAEGDYALSQIDLPGLIVLKLWRFRDGDDWVAVTEGVPSDDLATVARLYAEASFIFPSAPERNER